jgi:hypothetical protein
MAIRRTAFEPFYGHRIDNHRSIGIARQARHQILRTGDQQAQIRSEVLDALRIIGIENARPIRFGRLGQVFTVCT